MEVEKFWEFKEEKFEEKEKESFEKVLEVRIKDCLNISIEFF